MLFAVLMFLLHINLGCTVVIYDNYCSIVWGNISTGLSQRLEKLQNKAEFG